MFLLRPREAAEAEVKVNENNALGETGVIVEGEAPSNRTQGGPSCTRCNDERVIQEQHGESWWERGCPDCTEETEHYP